MHGTLMGFGLYPEFFVKPLPDKWLMSDEKDQFLKSPYAKIIIPTPVGIR
jgi:hypothetical protein